MKNNAEQILYSLRETIWVLNNKEISIVNFSDDFTTFCFKVLQNFEHINFEMEEQIITNRKITAADAINVNKILQEAFQNCIKHSNCTNIKYSIIENENILISIVDNGIGFNKQLKKHGNGLENIEWRAKEIGAILNIDSKNGVSITIEIPKK